jgi:hypothetical protein
MSEIKMQIVQRILSKIVGEQIPADEQELVSGGIPDCVDGILTRRATGALLCDEQTDC